MSGVRVIYPAAPEEPSGRPEGRPLRSWRASDRERLVAAAAAARREWSEAWGLGCWPAEGDRRPEEAISCASPGDTPASELSGPEWLWSAVRVGLWWSYRCTSPMAARPSRRAEASDPAAALSRTLFGELPAGWSPRDPRQGDGAREAPGGLARQVGLESWMDWWRRLERRLLGEPLDELVAPAGGFPHAAWGPWSGALVLSVPWMEGTLHLLIAGELVERVLGERQPRPSTGAHLTPAWHAAAGRQVLLRLETLPFELDVGALAGLRVGDVLQTTHTLDAPFLLRIAGEDMAGSEPVCGGFLGRMGQWRATDLCSAPSPRLPASAADAEAR